MEDGLSIILPAIFSFMVWLKAGICSKTDDYKQWYIKCLLGLWSRAVTFLVVSSIQFDISLLHLLNRMAEAEVSDVRVSQIVP